MVDLLVYWLPNVTCYWKVLGKLKDSFHSLGLLYQKFHMWSPASVFLNPISGDFAADGIGI